MKSEVYKQFNPKTGNEEFFISWEDEDGQTGGTHQFFLTDDEYTHALAQPNPEAFILDRAMAELIERELVPKERLLNMREVPRDDHWAEQREANDKRRDEYAVTDAADVAATQTGFEAGVELGIVDANIEAITAANAQPSETELVTIALLMRLYDINMAILSHIDKPEADRIYEAHENGGTFNPPIFIPSPTEIEDESEQA